MAALLQFAPVQGPAIAAIARLHQAVDTTLSEQAQRGMALVSPRAEQPDARPAFRADVARCRIPIPPH